TPNHIRRLRPLSGPLGRLSARSARSSSGFPAPEMPAAWVRSNFLDYFQEKHGHRLVPSSPVRPRGDPSLLFVNAGMNQFKPVFLGTADPRSEMASYRRVVNSQKCVRAGGKHNDLEDVGRDLYHHTFFEMLGNWSFGDYFKEEACCMAWSLLTEHYGIPADRLYVSYFGGDAAAGLPPDDETRHIWLEIGVPPGRLLAFGLKENFWEMGDSGPCGPCTEIHYDHVGGRDAASLVNADSPDVVEIWNLVFMQYNREGDQSLRLLPRSSVDTGMGLERLVSVLQGKRSNYDTDLFTPLLHAIHQVSKAGPYGGRTGAADRDNVDMAYRVVADHVRTLSVCIADGVHPGMSGAELVLRRILRRAVRFCVEVLQAPQGALASLVPTVTHILGVYRDIPTDTMRKITLITLIIWVCVCVCVCVCIPAAVAWSLHRDLGFPLDLVDLMLEERGVQVDRPELDRLIAQNQKSDPQPGFQSALTLDVLSLAELQRLGVPHTDDSLKYQYRLEQGRYVFPACSATVVALYDGQALVSEVSEGQRCDVILDQTCFYSEQGGQSHDLGYFTRDALQDVLFPVEAVVLAGGYVLHQVTATDSLKTGDQVHLHLDQVYPDPVRVVSVAVAVSDLLDDQTNRQTSVELCCGTHVLQTGDIEDLLIVSERQMVKGISRILAVTGRDAALAREQGQVLAQDVDSLTARISGSAPSSLDSAQRLAKEVGVLSDAVDNTAIPQWQRRELQSRLRSLQRTSNTAVRKLETREVSPPTPEGSETSTCTVSLCVSCQVVMKTVNQLSAAAPHSLVMLLAHQRHSGKVLCACQVPKDSLSLSASDWAVAVCRHLGGSAGGSALVAKGTGSSSDITEALRWAEEFARQKTRR
uniref:Alanine--tRNA ligase n=1 Tax=Sander lucioperca TaxID=283035 RepID=A0A8C9X8P5_SANLU